MKILGAVISLVSVQRKLAIENVVLSFRCPIQFTVGSLMI
jgi:hypothetical protein